MAFAGSQASPPNATALEHVLADADFARLSAAAVQVIRDVVDPWRCPAALLPWLAWSLSVDLWDDAWPEVRKRQAIAEAPALQRKKGTRAAVESALELLERAYDLTEWFEVYPSRRRGTFRAFVELGEADSLKALAKSARRLVGASKPKSRLAEIRVGSSAPGALALAGGVSTSTTITIEPLIIAMPEVVGTLALRAGAVVRTTLTVSPRT